MNEIMGNKYDAEIAEKESMGYKIVADDVAETRLPEFGGPEYMIIEKSGDPKTYTIMEMPPNAADEQNLYQGAGENPDSIRGEQSAKMRDILGEDILAGTPPKN